MNNKLKEIRIRTGNAGTLILFFSVSENLPWIKEKIIALMNGQEGRKVKSSGFAAVMQFENPLTGEAFYYKEFLNRGMKDVLKSIFGLTRGRRAFMAGHLLSHAGFSTPEPLLYGIHKRFFFIRKNFLITNAVPGYITYQYFRQFYIRPLSPELLEEKRELLYSAGHEVGRLHREGFYHGDLRVGNIIINGRGRSAQFYFIDNERTKSCKGLTMRKRLKNLVQLNMTVYLNITKTDRLRFFNAYIEENPSLLRDKKKLMGRIARITRKRLRGRTG
jgi:tRNA A-37 threonylcarbamoyl transferase component Bud32